MKFKLMLIFLETKSPSIIGAPIFMLIELILSIVELLVNINGIFKPMIEWKYKK